MNTPSLDLLKSPFGTVLQYVPQGHDKALKQAFYNTAATLFVAFVVGAAIAVYYILEAFLRPLLWAVLCGTFLHPFKQRLTGFVQKWLQSLRISHTPLVVGTCLIPVWILDRSSEFLGALVITNVKLIAGGATVLTLVYFLFYFGPLYAIFSVLQTVFSILVHILGYFTPAWVCSLALCFVLAVIFYWTPDTQPFLRKLSLPVWMLLLLQLANVAGPLRVPLALVSVIVMLVGALAEYKETKRRQSVAPPQFRRGLGTPVCDAPGSPSVTTVYKIWSSENRPSSDTSSDDSALLDSSVAPEDDVTAAPEPVTRSVSESACPGPSHADRLTPSVTSDLKGHALLFAHKPTPDARKKNVTLDAGTPQTQRERTQTETSSTENEAEPQVYNTRTLSDTYFIWLFWALVVVRVWINLGWMWQLMPVLFVVLIVKRVGAQIGVWAGMRVHLGQLLTQFRALLGRDGRLDALVPRPVRGVLKLCLRGDSKIGSVLESSMDKVVSVIVILLVLVGMVLMSFFMAIQVNRETMHLVSVSSNVFNQTMNPQIHKWIPDSKIIQQTFDSMAGNAYLHGRKFIASKARSLVDGDAQKAEEVEKMVLDVWDQLYKHWFPSAAKCTEEQCKSKGETGDARPEGRFRRTLSAPFSGVTSSSVWTFISGSGWDVVAFVNDNLGVLVSVMESVWVLLKSNINLAMTVVSALMSLVFGGGTAILNFILSIIVFITTLFYLLASSSEEYLPVQWIQRLTPAEGTGGNTVEEAISSVFKASLKMAVFYGAYTWLTHTVFGIQIVFIPSALAALFAAIPFVGTYWAALPALVELWLVHGELLLAALLLLAHFLPTYFVDTAIYSDIKGGHPYLTGLAIAGGIYWLGLEGAIIGPILLCSLIVAVNVYTNMITPEEGDGRAPAKSKSYTVIERQ